MLFSQQKRLNGFNFCLLIDYQQIASEMSTFSLCYFLGNAIIIEYSATGYHRDLTLITHSKEITQ